MNIRVSRLLELLVIVAAVLAPLFLMVSRIDSDEWEYDTNFTNGSHIRLSGTYVV